MRLGKWISRGKITKNVCLKFYFYSKNNREQLKYYKKSNDIIKVESAFRKLCLQYVE